MKQYFILFACLFFFISYQANAQFNIAAGDVTGLINAINSANIDGTNSVINLAAGSTYSLTTNEDAGDGGNYLPSIANDGNFTINGNGATLAGVSTLRILRAVAGSSIFLNNLTMAGGSTVSTGGGAILAVGGILSLTECTVNNCGSLINNSAIFLASNVALSMNRTTVSNSTIGSSGIFVVGNSSCNIQNSTISGNASYGIRASAPAVSSSVTNTTISGNTTGGIFWDVSSTLSVLNSTIVSNGTGLIANGGACIVNYQNCILGNATNTSTLSGGTVNNNGGNALNIGLPTWLNALADNGEATQTHAINTGTAPAVNIGVTTPVTPPATDQRGTSRVGGIDAGAFEFGGTLTTLTVTTEADAGVGSLRKAINDANTFFTGSQTINFNIQGGINGTSKTITLASALPDIITPVIINGYTQAGSVANTLSVGNDATINVTVDGAGVSGHGFVFTTGADNSEVSGVKINNWGGGAGDIGVYISGANNITVRGCWIGTGGGGFQGINISVNSSNVNIGGVAVADRNIVANCSDSGIEINTISNVFVKNTYIGTDAAGTSALPNSNGINISGINSNVVIGGTVAGEGNVISGNTGYGININNNSNTVQGNYIGTDATGTAALANLGGGIYIGGTSNTIGGNSAGARNIISGNNINGILIQGASATGNTVQGNYIGTALDGTSPLGNSLGGVRIDNASSNTIGGTGVGEGNTIAFTTDASIGYGVGITGTSNNNRILGNAMFGNTITGIDLGTNNITANDIDDSDTGENNLQNFPEFNGTATLSGATASLTYKVPSTTLNSAYPIRVEFFKSDGSRQGKTFLGFDTYSPAEANTDKALTFTPATALVFGDKIVATSTDNNGNTSEFSAELTVGLPNAGLHPDDYAALVALYNATNGNNWTTKTNWITGGDAATWFGLTLDANPAGPTRRVIQISLGGNNLVGSIPIELSNMSSLSYLDIGANSLTSIAGLPTNLNTLICSSNQLTSLSTLPTGLLSLQCHSNQLTTLPTLPTTLSQLLCYSNQLTSLPTLPSGLLTLQAYSNKLTSLPTLPSGLQEVLLQNNLLTGTIPASLSSLNSGMASIDLSNNQFTDMADFSGFGAFNPLEFNVSSNKLEFDDIKPNIPKLGLPKNYSPQAKIGTAQSFTLVSGASQTLTVSTPDPATAPTNTYQWYSQLSGNANSLPISGATSSSYIISSYNPATDAGIYYCEVTNIGVSFLTLTSENFSVGTNANGVFQQDYDALLSLYNTLGGSGWLNQTNWNTAADVSTWFGVRVVGGRVTEIRLPDNNLVGDLSNILAPLEGLKVLDLGYNKLTGTITLASGAPLEKLHLNNNLISASISDWLYAINSYASTLISIDLSNNQFTGDLNYDVVENFNIQPISLPNDRRGFNLSNNEITSAYFDSEFGGFKNPNFPNNVLNVSNNRLVFGDLADFMTKFYGGGSNQYAPQKIVLLSPKSVLGSVGINFSYNKKDFSINTCTVTHQWFSTSNLVSPVDADFNLNFTPFTTAKAGSYIMRATAPCVPGLTLETEVLTIGISNFDFLVDNNGDNDDGNYSAGDLTLREAINLANARANASKIGFNLPATNKVIGLNSSLPTLAMPITIDGTSQAGVVLNGDNNSITYALQIDAADCKIYGLEIRNISNSTVGYAIDVLGGATNFEIGANGKGNVLHSNANYGIRKNGGSGKIVGNTIRNQPTGIYLTNSLLDTYIQSNSIINNGINGIEVNGSSNTFIGTSGSGNTISANGIGVSLSGGNDGVRITGNNITSSSSYGIYMTGNNQSSLIESNTISGNPTAGIYLTAVTASSSTPTYIYSNSISTNGEGISIDAATTNTLIGEVADATKLNTITNNTNNGILIDGTGTDFNTIGQNAIFCNGGTNADRGISITTNGNGYVMALAPFTVALDYDCNVNTANLTITHGAMGANFDLDLYRVDASCGTNQGKEFIKSLGSVFFPLGTVVVNVPLSDFLMVNGSGTYVLLARDINGNSSQFTNSFTVYNKGTIISVEDKSYADCKTFNFNYEITFSSDSPDGEYYLDIENPDYSDIISVTVQNHKLVLNYPFGIINNPPMDYSIQGIAPYFKLTQPLNCLPTPQPFDLTPISPYTLLPPVIVSARTQDATRCDEPNGKLILKMQNVEDDRGYSIDINGDNIPDFEGVVAEDNQLIIDYIEGGTSITSIKVRQLQLFCESNVLKFSYDYPELPQPDITLNVYPELEFVDKGQSTKVIVEESENDINYQLQNSETDAFVGEPVSGNGATIELPTEKLNQTLTYRVVAQNKNSGCASILETSATVGVDKKCITLSDSLVLIDLYRSANGANWYYTWDLQLPACTWFGVELSGDRVVGLRLANNYLAGSLPISLTSLPKLKILDVSDNFFGFLPIEPLVGKISEFIYDPQAEIFYSETLKANNGNTVRISSLTGGAANKYQWYKSVNDVPQALKNGNNISGATNAVLVLSNVTIADEGDYFCEVTSPIAIDLTLYRAEVKLSIVPELSAADIAALIQFFNQTGGANWKKPWDINQPVSTWEGLLFENGNLLQINLSNNNLVGNIPNVFNAPIFEDLIYLNLSNNGLTGELPPSLKNLLKLTYLDLSQNDLEGEVPDWIGDFTDMTTLWLSYNRFSSLHPNIGNLFNLRNLFLNSNEFETIPDEIGDLTNLEVLELSDNYLEEITESIGYLLRLKYLSVANNFLVELPESITLLIDLESLIAYDNYLYILPQGLEKLGRLETVEFDFNYLDFGSLENLVERFKNTLTNLDFLYAPQARIGTEQEFDIPIGSPLILEIKTEGKNNTYQWYKDGKLIQGVTSAKLTIERANQQDAGVYIVFVSNRVANKLILQSENYIVRTNCVGSATNLAVEVRGATTYCDNELINTILVAPQAEGVVSYQWFINNLRISNANNDRITAREVGSYTVNLVTKENCVNTSAAVSIRRFATPQVNIKVDRDVLAADNRSPVVSYEWFFDGSLIPNESTPQLTATKSGRYLVRVTDTNGCKGTSLIYNHNLVSTQDIFFDQNLKIYPNPATNLLNVESKVDKILALQLYEVTGKKINMRTDEQTQRFILDISPLVGGVYLLEIKTVKGVIWKKIIKE